MINWLPYLINHYNSQLKPINQYKMKNTQTHRMPKVKAFNFKSTIVMSLIALNTFGYKAMSFFDKLLTIGCTPYENLNRGQLKRMYWLRYVAG